LEFRAQALASWGFECTCPLCTASTAEKARSDERRTRLREVLYIIQSSSFGSYYELADLTDELLGIAEQERLTRKMAEYYNILYRAYYETGDLRLAALYARSALKYADAFEDPEGAFSEQLRAVLRQELRTW
jgi:hypothetical protein